MSNSKIKSPFFTFNTYFDKGKVENQYKNAVLTKENISEKFCKGLIFCIQTLNVKFFFFRNRKHDKIRHLNLKLISRSGWAECSFWLVTYGDGDDDDEDVDDENSGGGYGGRNLYVEGVYNLTLVKINVFYYNYFETPGLVVNLLINKLKFTINKYY